MYDIFRKTQVISVKLKRDQNEVTSFKKPNLHEAQASRVSNKSNSQIIFYQACISLFNFIYRLIDPHDPSKNES